MSTPAEKLAELKALQDKGVIAIKSEALTRTHRERLLENKFIEEIGFVARIDGALMDNGLQAY